MKVRGDTNLGKGSWNKTYSDGGLGNPPPIAAGSGRRTSKFGIALNLDCVLTPVCQGADLKSY